MRGLKDRLRGSLLVLGEKLRTVFDLESTGRVLIYSALVGVVAGLGATAVDNPRQIASHKLENQPTPEE